MNWQKRDPDAIQVGHQEAGHVGARRRSSSGSPRRHFAAQPEDRGANIVIFEFYDEGNDSDEDQDYPNCEEVHGALRPVTDQPERDYAERPLRAKWRHANHREQEHGPVPPTRAQGCC